LWQESDEEEKITDELIKAANNRNEILLVKAKRSGHQ